MKQRSIIKGIARDIGKKLQVVLGERFECVDIEITLAYSPVWKAHTIVIVLDFGFPRCVVKSLCISDTTVAACGHPDKLACVIQGRVEKLVASIQKSTRKIRTV